MGFGKIALGVALTAVCALSGAARTIEGVSENKVDGRVVSLTVGYGAGEDGEWLAVAMNTADCGTELPDWASCAEVRPLVKLSAEAGSYTWKLPADWGVGVRSVLRFFVTRMNLLPSHYVQEHLVAQWDAVERGSDPSVWKDLVGTNDIVLASEDAVVSDDTVKLLKGTVDRHSFFLECFKSKDNRVMSEVVGFATDYPGTSEGSLQTFVGATWRFALSFRCDGYGYLASQLPASSNKFTTRGIVPSWSRNEYPNLHCYAASTWLDGGAVWIDNKAYTLSSSSGLNYSQTSGTLTGQGSLGANKSDMSFKSIRIYDDTLSDDARGLNYAIDRARFFDDPSLAFASAGSLTKSACPGIVATGVSAAYATENSGFGSRTVSVIREKKLDGTVVALTVGTGEGRPGDWLVAAIGATDAGEDFADWIERGRFEAIGQLPAEAGEVEWPVPHDWGTGSNCAVRFFVLEMDFTPATYARQNLVAQWDGVYRGSDPAVWEDHVGSNDIALGAEDAVVSDDTVKLLQGHTANHAISLDCFKSTNQDPVTFEFVGFATNFKNNNDGSAQVIVSGSLRCSMQFRCDGFGYLTVMIPTGNSSCKHMGISPAWSKAEYPNLHTYASSLWLNGGQVWIDNTAYTLSGLNYGVSGTPDGTGSLGAVKSDISYKALRIYSAKLTDAAHNENYAIDRVRFFGDVSLVLGSPDILSKWVGRAIGVAGGSTVYAAERVIEIATDTADVGAPVPGYGNISAIGQTYPLTLSAGARYPVTNVLYECWGYALGDTDGLSATTNEGDTVTFNACPVDSVRVTWLWRPCAYAVVAAPSGEGTETFSFAKGTYTVGGIEYYAPGAEVTVWPSDRNAETASDFIDWTVGAAPGSETANPLVFTMGRDIPRLTARFNRHWKCENDVLSDGNWHFTTTVRAGGGLKIVAWMSGSDELLDFSGAEADTGYKVAEMGARLWAGSPGIVTFVGPDVVVLGETSLNPSTLKSVTLSPDLTTIGRTAFWQAASLETFSPMVLPKLTTLGPYAFERTPNLHAHFVMPALTEISDGAFASDNDHIAEGGWLGIEATNVTTVGSQAFYMCRSLTNIVLSSHVRSIGGEAFFILPELVSFSPMRMPELTSLGEGAFANEWALDGEWDFPALTKIPANCFRSNSEAASRAATGRISVRATNAVEVGEFAFYWNWNVTNVVFSQRLTTISESAFNCCCMLKSFTPFLPKGVKTIGVNAFAWCNGLTTPLVSRGTTPLVVENYAFNNAYNIPSFDFRAPIASIGNNGFSNVKPGATIRLRGAPPATFGNSWISTHDSGSPYAILSVDAANYPAWLDRITYPVGSETFEKSYRNLSHYPGRQTLGVIKLGNQGAVWVVQSVNTGMMILIR